MRMSRKKYDELRRRRLKDRIERFRRERIRIQEQNEALRRRIKLGFVQRRKPVKKLFLEKEKERENREKAKEVIVNIQKTVETLKETKRISEYVPKLTSRIKELLSSAERSYRSANYEKVFDLTLELQELITKAEAEATKIIKEKKKRRKVGGKYFYAMISSSEDNKFGDIGMNDEEIYTLPYRDVAAVVSDTPIKEYELTEENTRRHEAALRKVMEEYTLVPVEFGTVINNERILKRLLRRAYKPTKECLKLVDNMVELGVKAILKKDIVYFEKERGKITSTEILESLKKKARQSVSGELFSDRLILNESFLVDKDKVDEFSEEVSRIEESYPMYKFLYSGPWAPYNFVYIRIGKEGMEFSKKR